MSLDPDRFLEAQRPVIDTVRAELRAGRKRTHWMWFVFPQIAGLGHSATARHYALPSLEAARLYLDHEVLGGRLRECTALALGCGEPDLGRLFGAPDDMKFVSSMTLFGRAAPEDALFQDALVRFNGGREDGMTLRRLEDRREA